MDFKYVNMDAYKRKEHFEYFSSLAYPYVGVTVNVDITELLSKIKEKIFPFFLTVCYCVGRAANAVPEFRQRIQDGQIVEYDHCRTSHTVALDDGTYCYCNLESDMGFADYIPYAVREQEKAKEEATIHEEDNLDMIFISTLPWLSYTSLVQPVPMPADSNPRITWGKYFQQEGKTFLPLSVLCHHALADGLHIARFYEQLDKEISTVAEM